MTQYYAPFWNAVTIFGAIAFCAALLAIAYALYRRVTTSTFPAALWIGLAALLVFGATVPAVHRSPESPLITVTYEDVTCSTWGGVWLPWSQVGDIRMTSRAGSLRRPGHEFLDFTLTSEGRALPWKNDSFALLGRARCPVDGVEVAADEIESAAHQHWRIASRHARATAEPRMDPQPVLSAARAYGARGTLESAPP
jgi:hypothetical protein